MAAVPPLEPKRREGRRKPARLDRVLNALDGAGRLTWRVKPRLRTGAVAFREWNQLTFQEPCVDIGPVSLLAMCKSSGALRPETSFDVARVRTTAKVRDWIWFERGSARRACDLEIVTASRGDARAQVPGRRGRSALRAVR